MKNSHKNVFTISFKGCVTPVNNLTVNCLFRAAPEYSHLSNKRAGNNKRAGLYFFTKFNKRAGFKINILKGN